MTMMTKKVLASVLPLSLVISTAVAQIDLSVIGENSWYRFKPAWSLTVNDQRLYEFVFQFEHDDKLPMGEQNFEGNCAFKDPSTKLPYVADDGMDYLSPRQHWERFPDYVWATIGFNHMSLDWLPCGHRPRGYSLPHYDFSFYRVTPEFRVHTMKCELLDDAQVIVPGEPICDFNQDSVEGMGFFVVPGALVNRNPVVNMPKSFTRPELGSGPVPHVGLRSWDQDIVPETPGKWNDLPLYMSSYAGDLVMWQAHVPYKLVSGNKDLFTSGATRYFETTVQTLPDTWAADFDESDGVIRFIIVGKSQLSREEFERAEKAFGGAPVWPFYPNSTLQEAMAEREAEEGANGENGNSGAFSQSSSFTSSAGLLLLGTFYLMGW